MSLDATILEVQRDGADVVLTLGPRIDDADRQSIAGQPKIRILDATWQPEPGMDIWGGGSSVQIITKRGARDPVTNNAIGPWYRREGYTRLRNTPSAIYKPRIFQDGNAWMAVLGEDIAVGVVGCGSTPAEAFADFDTAWLAKAVVPPKRRYCAPCDAYTNANPCKACGADTDKVPS